MVVAECSFVIEHENNMPAVNNQKNTLFIFMDLHAKIENETVARGTVFRNGFTPDPIF